MYSCIYSIYLSSPEENSFKESKKLAINKRDSVLRYHDLVVQDIIDSERTYVFEMMVNYLCISVLWNYFLKYLSKLSIGFCFAVVCIFCVSRSCSQ